MSLFRLFSSALFQRADRAQLTQFKPPALPSCEYSQELQINKNHYQQYCDQVGWAIQRNLHPCYLQTLSTGLQIKCLTTPNSPFPLMGLIHKTNHIVQSTMLDIESPITLYARYGTIRAHARGWLFDITVRGLQNKQQVYLAQATYLVKVKAPHVEPRKKQRPFQPFSLPDTAEEQARFSARGEQGRRYARVAGDYNPIHLSRITAAFFGFKRAIAHGMWTLAKSVSVSTQIMDEPASYTVDATFIQPVTLPASLRCLTDVDEDGKKIYVVGKNNTPHLTGRIQAVIS
ncbi:MaoC family dehydratase [Salinimonas chungwhensis]|uniref:MaoC family dehydratase n=1 Tax=Salinimonas chungwhensis TaxID=265425 RepID=UPI00036BC6DC|nr:MaoC/PaaZ C-terminal domain-containing protein [Salinimonas chungwhensis]